MGSFSGFDSSVFMLLELNKFNNSKDFYESVKDDIKKLAIEPMRMLASDLSQELFSIDNEMNLIPVKMVSRIRRDTRFSKNKQLYRSNVWCMFMRDKHLWKNQPCIWFEFFPDYYSYGIGVYRIESNYLKCFREVLSDNQSEFEDALNLIECANVQCHIECYKKDRDGCEIINEGLKKFYNSKNFMFVYYNNNMENLVNGKVKEELVCAIRAFTPMYNFLLKVMKKTYEKGDVNV